MIIQETIVQITILHPGDEEVAGCGLDDIAYEIHEGGWLGQMKVVSTQPVTSVEVPDRCRALGNDGTFFEEIEE